ncbi:MAG: LysE family transporter [Bacteroidales bacterium]|nr:LysE family transporter [Bacteroidales bacterium]
MAVELLKALLVGIIAAVPVGPIFIMAVQRTLCHRRRAGMMVGLGAAAGDMVYAAVGLLTLELIKDFVLGHQALFMIVGGLIIGAIGLGMFFREVSLTLPEEKRQVSDWTCATQAFVSTLSNPAALATMLALLTAFSLGAGSRTPLPLLALLVGVGEALYWFVVTGLLSRFLRIDERALRIVSKVAGTLVCVFAVVLLVRGIMMIIGN